MYLASKKEWHSAFDPTSTKAVIENVINEVGHAFYSHIYGKMCHGFHFKAPSSAGIIHA